MCLTVLCFQVSRRFPLILIHNRDEFYDRLAEPAHYWENYPGLLGGQDLRSKGMWLGTQTQHSAFAAITNIRDPKSFKPDAISRGFVVRDFLLHSQEPHNYVHQLELKIPKMNPFNLLFGTYNQPYFYSSRIQNLLQLPPGIHGLSNATLNLPWPKVEKSKKMTEQLITTGEEVSLENLSQALFEVLSNPTLAQPSELPETGLNPEAELALSSIFVKTKNYGTVSSSILLLDDLGQGHFYEKPYLKGHSAHPIQEFHWKIGKSS
jgi:uncharacterized protein with NRDE domain